MSWVIILVFIVLAGGIVFFALPTPAKKKTREEFLQELKNFVEGRLEKIEGRESDYRLIFTFENQNFIYEDVEQMGFDEKKSFKGYLRADAISSLNLSFSEREEKTKIRSEVILASEIPEHQPTQENIRVRVPKDFQGFKIYTNDPAAANQLFEDGRTYQIFRKYKNVDNRGFQYMPLKINQGSVVLEFNIGGQAFPNYEALKGEVPAIESHLKNILILIAKMKIL